MCLWGNNINYTNICEFLLTKNTGVQNQQLIGVFSPIFFSLSILEALYELSASQEDLVFLNCGKQPGFAAENTTIWGA